MSQRFRRVCKVVFLVLLIKSNYSSSLAVASVAVVRASQTIGVGSSTKTLGLFLRDNVLSGTLTLFRRPETPEALREGLTSFHHKQMWWEGARGVMSMGAMLTATSLSLGYIGKGTGFWGTDTSSRGDNSPSKGDIASTVAIAAAVVFLNRQGFRHYAGAVSPAGATGLPFRLSEKILATRQPIIRFVRDHVFLGNPTAALGKHSGDMMAKHIAQFHRESSVGTGVLGILGLGTGALVLSNGSSSKNSGKDYLAGGALLLGTALGALAFKHVSAAKFYQNKSHEWSNLAQLKNFRRKREARTHYLMFPQKQFIH